ncbi:hypothetical protein HanPSC8_Chr10g0428161 [Helianthus annuus]|nr:hypothetical protein HanPSC8_Chr10g0428161 [Helianthus annuus]
MLRFLSANFRIWTLIGSLKPGKFTVSDACETNPSLRPNGTCQLVPPACTT